MRDNDLVSYWKLTIGFDLWYEIGAAVIAVKNSPQISADDKLKALIKASKFALKVKKAGAKRKGGPAQVNVVMIDPR
jgi:hypothetical protein